MSRLLLRRHRANQPRSAVVGLMLGTLLLAGCGGGDDTDLSEDESPSPTTSQTPSTTTSQAPSDAPGDVAPEAPRARNTAESRKQFAEFVIASWSYALRTNDFKAVTGLSPRNSMCEGCEELRTELAKRKKQGWYVDFPGAEVRRVTVGGAGAPRTFVATAKVDIPESRSYFDDGTFRNDNDAYEGATFEVRMRLDENRYSLVAFSVT